MDRYPRSLGVKQRAMETQPCLLDGQIAELSRASHKLTSLWCTEKVSVPRYSPAVDIEVLARGSSFCWTDLILALGRPLAS